MGKNFEDNYGKKKYNIYSIFGIIGDILFYPIIIITLLSCVAVYVSKNQNQVPTFFGVSMVSISSASMVDGGFKVRDIVFCNTAKPSELRVGDIVTFYDYPRTQNNDLISNELHLLQEGKFHITTQSATSTDYDYETLALYQDNERTTEVANISKLNKSTKIIFHRIVEIYVDDDGTYFFCTKGDSNGDKTGATNNGKDQIICEDYVIGKYAYTPTFLRGIFQFVSTSLGIVLCIIVPLSIMILFMLFSIIEQISKIFIEKNVLARKIRYDSEESISANIGIEMDPIDKIEFYINSPPNEKIGVSKFLWGHLLVTNKASDESEYLQIMDALSVFESDSNKFWYFWTGKMKSKSKRAKVEKLWQKWYTEEKLRQFEKNKNAEQAKKKEPKISLLNKTKKVASKPKKNKKTEG